MKSCMMLSPIEMYDCQCKLAIPWSGYSSSMQSVVLVLGCDKAFGRTFGSGQCRHVSSWPPRPCSIQDIQNLSASSIHESFIDLAGLTLVCPMGTLIV